MNDNRFITSFRYCWVLVHAIIWLCVSSFHGSLLLTTLMNHTNVRVENVNNIASQSHFIYRFLCDFHFGIFLLLLLCLAAACNSHSKPTSLIRFDFDHFDLWSTCSHFYLHIRAAHSLIHALNMYKHDASLFHSFSLVHFFARLAEAMKNKQNSNATARRKSATVTKFMTHRD